MLFITICFHLREKPKIFSLIGMKDFPVFEYFLFCCINGKTFKVLFKCLVKALKLQISTNFIIVQSWSKKFPNFVHKLCIWIHNRDRSKQSEGMVVNELGKFEFERFLICKIFPHKKGFDDIIKIIVANLIYVGCQGRNIILISLWGGLMLPHWKLNVVKCRQWPSGSFTLLQCTEGPIYEADQAMEEGWQIGMSYRSKGISIRDVRTLNANSHFSSGSFSVKFSIWPRKHLVTFSSNAKTLK